MKKNGFLFLVIAVAAVALIGFHAAAFGDDCTSTCATCHTESFAAMNHPGGYGTPVMCIECHQQNRVACDSTGLVHSTTTTQTPEIDIVAIACTGCHAVSGTCGPNFSTQQLTDLAYNIHNARPVARFTAMHSTTTSYMVNFNAETTTCGNTGCLPCTYSWDFGQTGGTSSCTTGTTCITPHHYYTSAGSFSVELTVTDNCGASDTATRQVGAAEVNQAPTVGHGCGTCAGTCDSSNNVAYSGTDNLTVCFADTSDDTDGDSTALAYVNWGDGSPLATQVLGTNFTHTYNKKGTYKIAHRVRDTGGLYAKENITVTPGPAALNNDITVQARVGSTSNAVANATVYIKKNGLTKAWGTTDASGNLTRSLPPYDSYAVYIYKGSLRFDCDGTYGAPYTFPGTADNNPTAATVTCRTY